MNGLLAVHGNGCAEPFISVLKENMLWQRRCETVEDLRDALGGASRGLDIRLSGSVSAGGAMGSAALRRHPGVVLCRGESDADQE